MKNPIFQDVNQILYDIKLKYKGEILFQNNKHNINTTLEGNDAKTMLQIMQRMYFSKENEIKKEDLNNLLQKTAENRRFLQNAIKKTTDSKKQKQLEKINTELNDTEDRAKFLHKHLQKGLNLGLKTTVQIDSIRHNIVLKQFGQRIMTYCPEPNNFYPLFHDADIDIDKGQTVLKNETELEELIRIAKLYKNETILNSVSNLHKIINEEPNPWKIEIKIKQV